MTPQTEEAVRMFRLAERDRVAFDILRATTAAHISIVCFHAQQAVEKYLKAVLFSRGIEFRRTHDLEELAGLLAESGLVVPIAGEKLSELNPFAVFFRYDELEDEEADQNALSTIVLMIRQWAAAEVELRPDSE